ncbi:RsmB/NOP family class I SAM-dependent RNA methyltransferase [Candidatus Woesearchaeota archaeon]|nr:RsmB/NOP family class I SAM-dependent RNA methyltransferase [Candidatus Woesearchaeota archaeon]
MAEKKFFIERYRKLGWEFSEQEIKQAIRVNTVKISKESLKKRLFSLGVKTADISFVKDGLFIEKSHFSVGSAVEYLLGYYYIQEAASQFASELLNPTEKDIVLDCCAAPGGKTTHLSQLMKNQGVVVALDKKSQRLIALKNNIERMGCRNVVVYNQDALKASSLGIKFDKILLDAPCSGNPTQQDDWFDRRDLDGIRGNAENQRKLLKACYDALKPGGVLVYATCSLEPEENEENIEWFSKNFKVNLVTQKRFWPSRETQGFFAAKLVKT